MLPTCASTTQYIKLFATKISWQITTSSMSNIVFIYRHFALEHTSTNWPEKRIEPNPSYSGFGTARSLAKLWGIVASGGSHGGQTLMSARGLDIIDDIVITNKDRVIMSEVSWGHGVVLVSFVGPDVSY